MTRHFIRWTILLGSSLFAANFAIADSIGVGKPLPTSDSTLSTETSATTSDSIGVGAPDTAWYEPLLAWFESDDTQ
ncbi:MAG TPA: hypothetical protein VF267_05385 [Gammaproteobacteria bacterium]